MNKKQKNLKNYNFLTIPEILESAHQRFADRPAMRMKTNGEYKNYSYADFYKLANDLGISLMAIGMKHKSRIAVLSENCPEWGLCYMSIVMIGAEAVPMDAQLKEAEIIHIINDSETKTLFCSYKQYEKVNEVVSQFKKLKNIIVYNTNHKKLEKSSINVIRFEDFLKKGNQKNEDIRFKIKPNDVASLIYTSGTTGSAKGVILTHKNFASNVNALNDIIYYDESDVFLSVLPIHHTFEFTAGFLIPISSGSSITFAESLKSKMLVANMKETKVTIIMGVPLLYEKLADGIIRAIKEKSFLIRAFVKTCTTLVVMIKSLTGWNIGKKIFKSLREKAGLGNLRFLISGAAALRKEIADFFENLGISVLQGYGLTEASPVIAANSMDAVNNESVGQPLPNVEVAIHNPNKDGIGEIIARGPSIMQGYYKNPEATANVLKDGWLHTGDCGYLDKNNFLFITGRLKNIIVTSGGKNVFPEEIEDKLKQSLFVLESMVYGQQTSESDRGEIVHAIIVPDYEHIEKSIGIKATQEKIKEIIYKEINKINSSLISYKRIKEIFIREEELPKTSTRKVKRYLLKT